MNAIGFLLLLLLLLLPLHSCSSSVTQLFEAWLNKHGKTYSSEEEKQRKLEIFEDNYDFVKQPNDFGYSSYSLSLNSFADLTHREFEASHLGLAAVLASSAWRNVGEPREVCDIPDSIDWNQEGAVTDVKDQGSCATGAMEGIKKIVTNSLVSLSEQELIDCSLSYNKGCEGGLVNYAYKFFIDNHGINTNEEYPYRAHEWECDKHYLKRRYVTIDGYKDVAENNETLLLQAVAVQPGIFTGPCSRSLNHAVLIVGYDSLNGVDYWIVKNSWGHWGMGGYILLQRNTGDSQGLCGINMLASYPTKTSPNPPAPPPPGPVICDLLNYCSEEETCRCTLSFLGICLAWQCCAYSSVCCKDHHRIHCRPSDYPVWNTKRNMYLKHTGNATTKAFKKRGFFRKFGGWNSFAENQEIIVKLEVSNLTCHKQTQLQVMRFPSISETNLVVVLPRFFLGICRLAATGAVEGTNMIVTGSLVSLSEQELIDCNLSYNKGCEGGFMGYAYQPVTEHSNPTTVLDDDCCLGGIRVKKHGKTYSSEEEKQRRLEIFEDNYAFVKQHNELGNSSYSLSLNAFADLTNHEFKASYLGGANWAFAATGAIEGINKIVTGSLLNLSAQELIDCDISHNLGCVRGFMDYAYQFVNDNHGINTEDEYPYLYQQDECDKDFVTVLIS
ncbi:hypothetical protein EZV62_021325 [Acer yangbiense]|uniref:Galectin domain-containing protein n=1 Tax=Acer yangbiense TaxID=1000413 RepID=A0A5C7H7F0_9ROSI|nr:hypothetical protein EZV62_021325 [Acer yangbiense]